MAQELVKIDFLQIGESKVNSVNARDLWKYLEIGKDFSDWIKIQIERALLEEHKDYEIFDYPKKGTQTSGRGGDRRTIEYALTLEAAKNIGMISRTEKGKEVRAYFIKCEKELLKPKLTIDDILFKSTPKMLHAYADSLAETRELAAKIIEDAPKVAFHKAVGETQDLAEVTEFAKALGIGRNKFYEWMREQGYLTKQNLPFQIYQDKGYFKVVEKAYLDEETGSSMINFQTYITGPGQHFLTQEYKTQRARVRKLF